MVKSFELLKALVCERPDLVDVGGGASSEVIKSAEESLGVTFPESLILYFKTWGNLAVGPFVFYGIVESDFIKSKVPDAIWFTANKRIVSSLPANLFVIFNNEGDEFHCMDLETEEIKSWDTARREVVAVKAANIFDYIIRESADFL